MQHCMPCPDIELNVEESCANQTTMNNVYANIHDKTKKSKNIINEYSIWKGSDKKVKTPLQVRLTSIVDWMRNEFSGLQSVRLPGQNQTKKDKRLEFWDAIFLFTDKIHTTSTPVNPPAHRALSARVSGSCDHAEYPHP